MRGTPTMIARLIREANKNDQRGAKCKASKKNDTITVKTAKDAIRAKKTNS